MQSAVVLGSWRGPNPPSEVAAGEAPITHVGELPAPVSAACWEAAAAVLGGCRGPNPPSGVAVGEAPIIHAGELPARLHIPIRLAETGFGGDLSYPCDFC